MAKAKKDKKAKEAKEPEAEREEGAGEEGAPEGEGEGASEDGAEPKKKKLSGRTLILFIVLPAVLVIGLAAGAAFMFLGKGDKDAHAEEEAKKAAESAVFFDLPELLVNLSAAEDGKENLLKISMALELPASDAVPKVEAAMPRVIDGAQVFLREMRLADLDGSAGMLKLREELLKRVNAAVAPLVVRDVLFKEIIVQ